MKALIDKCKRVGERSGFLPLIDGRKIILRKFDGRVLTNTALNCLLQGSGSVVVKNWIVAVNQEIRLRNLDSHQVLFMHDEIQLDTAADCVDEVIEILQEKMIEVGEYFRLRIPLSATVAVGNNWKETH